MELDHIFFRLNEYYCKTNSGSIFTNYLVSHTNRTYFENNWKAPVDVVLTLFQYVHS